MEIKELSNTLTSVETLDNKNSNSEMFTQEQIEDTPFTIIKHEEQYFGVLGKHRITQLFDTKEECEADLKEINWNRVMQVIWAVVEKFTKVNINDLNEK
ncbi:putative VP3 [Microviridae sp.]|nr:putative VP3 [Microviridae sp.]